MFVTLHNQWYCSPFGTRCSQNRTETNRRNRIFEVINHVMNIGIESRSQNQLPALKIPMFMKNQFIVGTGIEARSLVNFDRRNVILKPDIGGGNNGFNDITTSSTKIEMLKHFGNKSWFRSWHSYLLQHPPVELENDSRLSWLATDTIL